MLLIYSPGENPRKTWTFDLVFGQLLGIPFRITGNLDEFSGYEGPRLNYSPVPFDHIPFILSSGILDEEGIRDQSSRLNPETRSGFPVIFRNDPRDSGISCWRDSGKPTRARGKRTNFSSAIASDPDSYDVSETVCLRVWDFASRVSRVLFVQDRGPIV